MLCRQQALEVHDDVVIAAAGEEDYYCDDPEDAGLEGLPLGLAVVSALLLHGKLSFLPVPLFVAVDHGHHHREPAEADHEHHEAHLQEADCEVPLN